MTEGPWAARLLRQRLRQPDARSCGAASLVVGRAVRDEAYARFLLEGTHPVTGWGRPGTVHDRFRAEVLAMHARVTGPADVLGRLQLPWPRALGTPPWAVARQLSTPQQAYAVRQALVRRGRAWDDLCRAVGEGRVVPVFIGNRWAPRHVVLALPGGDDADEGVRWYDPAAGRVVRVGRAAFVDGPLAFGRWARPWFVVGPRFTG